MSRSFPAMYAPGIKPAAIVMVISMFSAFLLNMYEKNGLPLEKVLENIM